MVESLIQGLEPTPKKGLPTRYPYVMFRAVFLKHSGESVVAEVGSASARSEPSITGRVSSDVIQCDTHKVIGQPIGSYTLTLIPRKDYFEILEPGDWCMIETDNGDGNGWRTLMYGPVGDITRSRMTSEKGAVVEVIRVTGSDFGKVFASNSLVLDQRLANDPAFSSLGFASLASTMKVAIESPATLVKKIIEYSLKNGPEQYIDPATGLTFGKLDLDFDYITEDVVGSIGQRPDQTAAPFQTIVLNGSLWQALEQWGNLCINELFIDYRPPFDDPSNVLELAPAVILRQCPYVGSQWENLTNIFVDRTEVISDQMTKSDSDVKNWIRVQDDPSVTHFQDGLAVNIPTGTCNPESIKKFGFRRHEPPTLFVLDSRIAIPEILPVYSGLVSLWHHSNEKFISGSMEMYHRPEIRVGYKLTYQDTEEGENEPLEFYIEGVSHSLRYPGKSTTSVTLTRGRRRNDSLLNQSDITILRDGGVLKDLGSTIQRASGMLQALI